MQSTPSPLRTACSAHNAYNPTLALASILSGADIVNFRARPVARSQRWCALHKPRSERRFSTAQARRQQASVAIQEDDVQEIVNNDSKRLHSRNRTGHVQPLTVSSSSEAEESVTLENSRLGNGDTFANLEALTNPHGPIGPAAPKHNVSSAVVKAHRGWKPPERTEDHSSPAIKPEESQETTPKSLIRKVQIFPTGQVKHRVLRQDSAPSEHHSAPGSTIRFVSKPLSRQPSQRTVTSKKSDVVEVKIRLTNETSDRDKEISEIKNAKLDSIEAAAPQSWQMAMAEIQNKVHKLSQDETLLSDAARVADSRRELDYEGKFILYDGRPTKKRIQTPWRLNQEDLLKLDPRQWLGKEIGIFVEHMTITEAEQAARDVVVSLMMTFISLHCKPASFRAELFGSQKTGLAMPTSDIDIRLTMQDGTIRRKPLERAMMDLFKALNTSKDWICAVHRHAKYPIINVQHKDTGLDLQIVVAPSTNPQEEITSQYLAELPTLRPLYTIVKTALNMRGLNEPFYGGTGSYPLLVMVAATLKRERSSMPMTTRSQLLFFLKFWGELDTSRHGVSLSPTTKLFLKHNADEYTEIDASNAEHSSPLLTRYSESAKRRGDPVRAGQWAICRRSPIQPYLLCLQDPSNPANDLGRKASAIKHVIATLFKLENEFRELQKTMLRKCSLAQRKGQNEWKVPSLLSLLVGRPHEVYYERRKRLEEYGRRVLEGRKGVEGEANFLTDVVNEERAVDKKEVIEARAWADADEEKVHDLERRFADRS